MTPATYETDFYLWTQQQAALLRQGPFNRVDLDLANIAEEIESMGKSDRRAIESHLFVILLHLLKWQFQPSRRGKSRNTRSEITTAASIPAKMYNPVSPVLIAR